MARKSYAVLLAYESEETGHLYFPIKRDDAPRYAGMPQFFGGTNNPGESDRDAIKREMLEESNGKLTLEPGGLQLVYRADAGGNELAFYVAENFKGHNFLGPLPDNPEMKSIDKFMVTVDAGDTIEDLLQRVHIVPSEEFTESETYEAFNKAIEYAELPVAARQQE